MTLGRALVTGGAGFIGSTLVDRLLIEGWRVTVVDNFDAFYTPSIKRRNIAPHLEDPHFTLVEADIRDLDHLRGHLRDGYDVIVHLAAKAGVRPSIQDPLGYQEVNILGTNNLLELAREWGTRQFVFGSSSSVYGVSPSVPWREDDPQLMPISPYSATKISGELIGRVYSHLYGIRFIALRFFTVFGPRQRPDLAIHKFARLMLGGHPLTVFGDGSTRRDYTYVDDIVDGVRAAMEYAESPYEVFNLGNNQTVSLLEMIRALEEALEVEAQLEYVEEQPGDVPQTWADLEKSRAVLGYSPRTQFPDGVKQFAAWLKAANEETGGAGAW